MTTPQPIDPAALRARLMLSLDEMAVKLGVNRSTVWRWEQGVKPIPRHMRKLARLAQAGYPTAPAR